MSFNSNPYKHLEIKTNEDGTFAIECGGCGMVKGTFPPETPVLKLRADYDDHVRNSHRRTRSDFEGWH